MRQAIMCTYDQYDVEYFASVVVDDILFRTPSMPKLELAPGVVWNMTSISFRTDAAVHSDGLVVKDGRTCKDAATLLNLGFTPISK
jgi:hypothetical protein